MLTKENPTFFRQSGYNERTKISQSKNRAKRKEYEQFW